MSGLPICSSFIPLARQSARAPAIRRPEVLVWLFKRFFLLRSSLFAVCLSEVCFLFILTLILFVLGRTELFFHTFYSFIVWSWSSTLPGAGAHTSRVGSFCSVRLLRYILHNPFPNLTG